MVLAAQPEKYDVYALDRQREFSARVPVRNQALKIPDEKFYLCNLADAGAIRQAVEGMDVVVHLGADPGDDGSWDSMLNNNVVGTYNVFIVMMMLNWEIGLRSGWETTLGSNGKHLESFLPADVWTAYSKTYVGSDYEDLWISLFRFHSFFERSAKFVATDCGYRFPKESADNVLAFLEHVRDLPADAERIY